MHIQRGAWAEINLDAVAHNVQMAKANLKPTTKLCAVVKADAYGHGAVRVAQEAARNGADFFAVALLQEGVKLREAGIETPILVLGSMLPEVAEICVRYDISHAVFDEERLYALNAAALKLHTKAKIHIKIDTGMHRLGFAPSEIPQLVQRLQKQSAVIPRSVFSHLVGSDAERFDAFTRHQIETFEAASTTLQEGFKHKIIRHICNTAGIERYPGAQFDMVRLGIGLYGVDPFTNKMLHNVTTLKTTILQIHEVPADETVGYSRKGVLTRDSRIAAIPIGYADGLNRHLGNGHAYCLVNGQKAPYVGNICMDVCMIDVTDIDCKEGDKAIIFGDDLPVTVLSDILETIPYEILTSVSNRVKRVYYQD